MTTPTPSTKPAVDKEAGEEFTPAAEVLVEQYTERLRQRVLDASRSVQSGDPSDPIRMDTVRGALEATLGSFEDTSIEKARLPLIPALPLRRVTILLLPTGLSVILLIVAAFIAPLNMALPLMLASLALCVTVMVFVLSARRSQYNRARSEERNRARSRLLRDFAILELEARRTAGRLVGADAQAESLAFILAALHDAKIWDAEDVRSFRAALRLRNEVVHGRALVPLPAINAGRARMSRLRARLKDQALPRKDVTAAGIDYERTVSAALRRVFGDHAVSSSFDSEIDYLVELPTGSALIAVKHRPGASLKLRDLSPAIDATAEYSPLALLVVTNAPHVEHQVTNDSPRYRVVQWTSPSDDSRLAAAVSEFTDYATPPSAIFEIFEDTHGRYRFRVRSKDGAVIAVGEAFDTRAGVLRSIDLLKSAVAAALAMDQSRIGADVKRGHS